MRFFRDDPDNTETNEGWMAVADFLDIAINVGLLFSLAHFIIKYW